MYVDTMLMIGGKVPTSKITIESSQPPDTKKKVHTIDPALLLDPADAADVIFRYLYAELLCGYSSRPGYPLKPCCSLYAEDSKAPPNMFFGVFICNKKDMPTILNITDLNKSFLVHRPPRFYGDDKGRDRTNLLSCLDLVRACYGFDRQEWNGLGKDMLTDFDYAYDNTIPLIKAPNRMGNVKPSPSSAPSPAVLTCPECPHWGLMTGRCSKTGLERGSNDVCTLPKGGTNVR